MPTVLMGDLNEWSAQGGCLRDFAHHFHFADCGKSFHARRPVARLDRIMHCAKLYAQNSGVNDSPSARKASDNLPIWARSEERRVGKECVGTCGSRWWPDDYKTQ